MINAATFRKLALSLPGTEEAPHFDRAAFKVTGRRIFATLHEESMTANLFLPVNEQAVYTAFDGGFVYPVPNKFGLQGWTTFELKSIPLELVSDALLTAYNGVLNTKPAKKNKR